MIPVLIQWFFKWIFSFFFFFFNLLEHKTHVVWSETIGKFKKYAMYGKTSHPISWLFYCVVFKTRISTVMQSNEQLWSGEYVVRKKFPSHLMIVYYSVFTIWWSALLCNQMNNWLSGSVKTHMNSYLTYLVKMYFLFVSSR